VSQDLPSRADVVIVGGGIIGVSVAYYLALKGVSQVLLLERGMMGQGSTGKCAGGIRSQFSTEINVKFSLLSRSVFDKFQETFGVDPEFRRVGYLFLASTAGQWAQLRRNAQLLEAHGVAPELLEPDEISRKWPFLEVHDLLGGSYSPDDGYAGPYEVLQGFAKGARSLGARLAEGGGGQIHPGLRREGLGGPDIPRPFGGHRAGGQCRRPPSGPCSLYGRAGSAGQTL
jgi:sarcosine oxidase subunit beta